MPSSLITIVYTPTLEGVYDTVYVPSLLSITVNDSTLGPEDVTTKLLPPLVLLAKLASLACMVKLTLPWVWSTTLLMPHPYTVELTALVGRSTEDPFLRAASAHTLA